MKSSLKYIGNDHTLRISLTLLSGSNIAHFSKSPLADSLSLRASWASPRLNQALAELLSSSMALSHTALASIHLADLR